MEMREVQVIEGVGRVPAVMPGTEMKSGLRWKTITGLKGVSGRFFGLF
jgi:hypothetical protein